MSSSLNGEANGAVSVSTAPSGDYWRHKYNNAGKNWRHTGDVWRYGLRLLVTAVVAEAPYDKIVTGRWWDWSVMNPIFGLLIALVVCALAV